MIDFNREAQIFVNGMRLKKYKNGEPDQWDIDFGNFHSRWTDLPLVRRSIAEGWDKEMRGHLTSAIKALLFHKVGALPPADVQGLSSRDVQQMLGGIRLEAAMPEADLADHWAKQAERRRRAEAWRERNSKVKFGRVWGAHGLEEVASAVVEHARERMAPASPEAIKRAVDERAEQQRRVMDLLDAGQTVAEVAKAVGVNRHEVQAIIDRALRAHHAGEGEV